MAACCAQGRAPVGLIFYKLLRTRGVEADERSSLDLLAALEAGAHAEGAFELRTLLELRGFALTELHGGKGAGAGAGAGGGQSSRAAAAPSAAAPSAAAPSAAARESGGCQFQRGCDGYRGDGGAFGGGG